MISVFIQQVVIKIIIRMSKLFDSLDSSTVKKLTSTDRKSVKRPSLLDMDYQLEKRYLEKLKQQRIKAEKLYSQYIITVAELKKHKEDNEKLQREVEELRAKYQSSFDQNRNQILKFRTSVEQQENQIKRLTLEKNNLAKKYKEQQNQLSYYENMKEQQKSRIEGLQEEITTIKNENKKMTQKHYFDVQNFRQKLLSAEKNNSIIIKELKSQKQQAQKQKTSIKQQRDKWQRTALDFADNMEKIKYQYETDLAEKERGYRKFVEQLQESKNYWSSKCQEKSKEALSLRKAVDQQKQQYRRDKDQVNHWRDRLKQLETKYELIQKELNQALKVSKVKEQQYFRLQKENLSLQSVSESRLAKIKALQEQNMQLKEYNQEYEALLQQRKMLELQRKQLLQDEYEEIGKFEKLFKHFD